MAVADTKIRNKATVNTQPPAMWKVIMLNDNVTSMELVIELLTRIFKHSVETATEVMMEIHTNGSGVAGVYSFEIAEQKSLEATAIARANGFPLQLKVEKE